MLNIKKTFYCMQNEKDYLNQGNEFEHTLDFVKFFYKKERCIAGIGAFR